MNLKGMDAKWKRRRYFAWQYCDNDRLNNTTNSRLYPKNIITNFQNRILIILVYKKLQSHFIEKEYLGNKHIHGWGTFWGTTQERNAISVKEDGTWLFAPIIFEGIITFPFNVCSFFSKKLPYKDLAATETEVVNAPLTGWTTL